MKEHANKTVNENENVSEKQSKRDAATGVRGKERRYWLNKLDGGFVKSCFPFDMPPNSTQKREVKSYSFQIPQHIYSPLTRLSNNSDIRLYIVLMTGMVLLLNKYTAAGDITLGAPIYRQNQDGDFINKIVVLRNRLDDGMSFKELLLQVSKGSMEAMEHINYPLETIPYELGMNIPDNEFPLFDMALLLDNIHDKRYMDHLSLELVFSFSNSGQSIEGSVDYNAGLYHDTTIRRIVNHYFTLMEHALNDIGEKISTISALSPGERKMQVETFNETGASYPGDKTLHQLFHQQAARTPDNIALQFRKQTLTYTQLQQRVEHMAAYLHKQGVGRETIVAVLLEHSMELVVSILAVLRAGGAYLPIDPDYPQTRIHYLLTDSQSKHLISTRRLCRDIPFDGALVLPEEAGDNPGAGAAPEDSGSPEQLAYIIYTSGTTGKPKGVMITHQSAVNYIWWSAQTYLDGQSLDFPLYSSISFDLTVTSIFTPLITGNKIIIYGGGEQSLLLEQVMDDNQAGVVKLTPSHLYMIKYRPVENSSIRCFIAGGEALENRIAREIHEKFDGNVKIYNEYGPTETTVGCLIYRYNPEEESGLTVPVGTPINQTQVYILDRTGQPAPIGVRGEIYISGDGVARGYLNSPGLSAEKFLPNPFIPGQRMYKTGDQARMTDNGQIEFLGRLDHQVKIRGYRIELGEIEQAMAQHPDITEAVAIARDWTEKSSDGEKQDQYLVAYFKADTTVETGKIREHLSLNLPDYMVPFYYVQLEEFPLTPNGKIDRNALPVPEIKREQNHVAPRNDIEEKLVQIWAEVLRLDADVIGIDSSFFELGGQSLKQVFLISMIHKEFNIKIPLVEIFKRHTIRELSQYIEGAAQERYVSIEAVEKRNYYSVSSAQRRMFILMQIDPDSVAYNQPNLFQFEARPSINELNIAFRKLLQRHEILRTSFRLHHDQPVQIIHEEIPFEVQPIHASEENLQQLLRDFVRPFDLSMGPMLRVGLVNVEDKKHLLVTDNHHIVSDGASWVILIRDFLALYSGQDLPPLKLQYKDYAQWQNSDTQQAVIRKQEAYWLKRFSGKIPVLDLPLDFPRPDVQDFEGGVVHFSLDAKDRDKLNTLASSQGVTLYMLLLTLYIALLHKITGQEDIVVGSDNAGRNHDDLQQVIGMFTNTLALRNTIQPDLPFTALMENVKDSTLEAFENQDYQFEKLVEQVIKDRDMSRNPLFDAAFFFLNLPFETEDRQDNGSHGLRQVEYKKGEVSMFDLVLSAEESQRGIFCSLQFAVKLFKKEKAEAFTFIFKEIATAVIENSSQRLNDIPCSLHLLSSRQEAVDADELDF